MLSKDPTRWIQLVRDRDKECSLAVPLVHLCSPQGCQGLALMTAVRLTAEDEHAARLSLVVCVDLAGTNSDADWSCNTLGAAAVSIGLLCQAAGHSQPTPG